MNSPQVNLVKRKSGRKKIQRILYPCFVDCSKYTVDGFYVDLLSSCAMGRFPKGMSISGKTVCIYDKKNTIRIDMSVQPQELCTQLVCVFRDTLNLCSTYESKKVQASYARLCDTYGIILNKSWGKWTKTMKQMSIVEYIALLGKKLHISPKQMIELYLLIMVSLSFGWIKSSNVVCKNKHIIKIHGLYMYNNRFFVDKKNRPSDGKSGTHTYNREKKELVCLWDIYLSNMKKNYESY